jgi:signal transduction histidine kinase/CheY-like chemotaxis protein
MLLVLVPLGFAGMFMLAITQDELRSTINDNIVGTAKELGQQLEDKFRAWQTPLVLLRNAIDQPELEASAKVTLLQSSAGQLNEFFAIGLMVEGFETAYFVEPEFNQFLSDADINLNNLNWPHPQNNLLQLGQARQLGPYWILPLALSLQQPINNLPAQLVALVDLSPIQYFIKGHPFTRYGNIVLVDHSHTILFGNALNPVLETPLLQKNIGSLQTITTQNFTMNGQARLGASVSGQLIPWTITVSLAEEDAKQTIYQMRQHLGGWLLAGFVAAFFVAWWFARHISAPVLEVANVAQRVGMGDLTARVKSTKIGSTKGGDEISLLGACINDMVKSLLALHAAGAGTFHYDAEHDWHEWDTRSLDIFGLSPNNFTGCFAEWWACVHPDDLERVKQNISLAIAMGRAFDEEYRIICPHTQEARYVRTQGFTVQDRHGRQVSGLHSDITPQKEAEKDLIRAREAAEAANRAKSTFLANMSHELRTPLNAVLGYAQILEQDASLSDKHRHSVEIMHRSGEYLLTLINDILDLAKIEAGRFELYPAPCALQPFFLTLVDMFSLRARQKDIKFSHESMNDMPEAVLCDEKRLRQVVTNLLGNAMKFTEQGAITLRSSYHDEQLSIAVEDSGIGIGADAIKDIFEPFSQTGTNNYKAQGTGLGLSITLKLVKLMGGKVNVKSLPGQGSTFEIQIPAPLARLEKPQHQGQQSKIIGYYRTDQENSALTLLIADDVPENRDILLQLFHPLGFIIKTAEDGQMAFELAQQIRPDILLIDLVMPKMNGLDVVRALRQLPECRNIKIIALSASVFAEDHTHSLEAGCDAHLPKPFRREELFQVLHNLLPLEWTHGAPLPQVQIAQSKASHDAKLPADVVRQLLELAQRGNIKTLRKQLDELQAQADYPAIIEDLQSMAKHFKIGDIRKLLENYT